MQQYQITLDEKTMLACQNIAKLQEASRCLDYAKIARLAGNPDKASFWLVQAENLYSKATEN